MSFFQNEMFPHSGEAKMSIRDFENRVDAGDMVIPDYQRKYVWTKKQQQSYLFSISNGFPLFGPVVNVNMHTGINTVMDGQNRLWTIYKFLKDEITYEDVDEEEVITFSSLPDHQKRRFRLTTISYLETRGWSLSQCQDFFVSMNGGGSKLKVGELINSDRNNIFTQMILELGYMPRDVPRQDDPPVGTYYKTLSSKAKDGGFQLPPGYMKRFGHYEILGTIFNMVGTGEFPVRPGPTALKELEKWRGKSVSDIFTTTLEKVHQILCSYRVLLANVPRLRQTVAKETHLRLMFFILKTEIYLQDFDETHYSRIETILNHVLNKDYQDYKDIITWGTGDCIKIYELYQRIYDSC